MSASKKEPRTPPRKVPAVSRAIAILDYLSNAKEPLGVVPLARHIGLIPSTCLHILRALTENGLVAANPKTKQYSIGAGVLSLARAYARQDQFIQITHERLEELSHKYQCSFAALERSGADECIVVAIGDVKAGLSVRVTIGARFPILVSSAGLCFAAFGAMSDEAIRKGFRDLEWAAPFAFKDWLAEVEKTRKNGYAVDDDHFIIGTRIISVPVFQPDQTLLGCISAVGLRERIDQPTRDAIVKDMRTLADEARAALADQAEQSIPRTPRRSKARPALAQ